MVHIVSQTYHIFRNRHEAGLLLAEELRQRKNIDSQAVVLGVPRGGVVVAHAIAQKLQLPLNLVLAGKLAAPYQPELAIGAIDENGSYFVNKQLISLLQIDDRYIEEEKSKKLYQLKEKSAKYRAVKPGIRLTGKTVIVADDGIATGASMQAALRLVKQENPQKLIAALPVGPVESIRQLENWSDEVICWQAPASFGAVGEFYEDFSQTTDEEVIEILREYNGGV